MDVLTLIPWTTIGPGGLLAFAVLLIIRGDLVPRRTFDAMVQDRDYWREAAERRENQFDALSETARTAVAALDALPPRRDAEV